MIFAQILVFVTLLFSATIAACYEPLHDYSGDTFMDGWDFYGKWDNLTLGNVTYLTAEAAAEQKLVYVNDAGNVILRVDNFTDVKDGGLRNSIRLTSSELYDFGSLWIIDAYHLPYGCSVWPAFWSFGPHWPYDGEIDIIEAINTMPNNQMALHTTEGCYHDTPPDQTGFSIDNDCGTASGCTVGESAPNSYESGFAAAGGGVFATQFDVTGIYIWFWSRPNVPASITNATANSSIDISSWGPPSASYPNGTSCDISKYYTAQQLVFDITLCGDWAGVPGIYDSTCYNAGPTHDCYLDNVVGNGSNYDEAYFEVAYVRTYTTGVAVPSSTSAAATAVQTHQATQTQTQAQKSDARSARMGLRGSTFFSILAALLAATVLC
ncbi:glycoside hydrolase family 16 protein [Wolfiporia cocos MD-104 SS10]|uniref:Glycoside hydrolase family 16 protein n=1 Tax=Wolfiporia cocos (strain MD-104) TaxID=742152 RepID=A0A2H3JS41_WOLCO|nr:glycoside hydrolase family 16 protein [Wolfiporia cocos MD-104 SS10]